MAVIELTPKGENRIIAFLGANGSLSVNDLKRLERYWKGVDVFVTQLEIPFSTVEKRFKNGERTRCPHSPQSITSGSTSVSCSLFGRFHCAQRGGGSVT